MRSALVVGLVGLALVAGGCAGRPAGSTFASMAGLGATAGLDGPTVDVVVRQGARVIVPQATRTHNCPSNSAERGHAIASDDAGNVLVVLYELAPSGSLTFRLRRLDPDGAISWSRTISEIPGSGPISLRIARSGDVMTAPRSLAALGR